MFRSEVVAGNESVIDSNVTYFNNGQPVPPGMYTIRYLDGCNKYSMKADYGWTVNGVDAPRCCEWWLVLETSANREEILPALTGAEMYSEGAFADFEACVAASKLSPPLKYIHHGGRLGVWMRDLDYTDNVAGLGGRNPRWEISGQTSCE
jgi:hypothetical protein